MKNKIKFQENMSLISVIFDKVIPNTAIDIYWEVLKPYSDDECINAFKYVLGNNKFFPKPADLIEFLREKEKAVEKNKAIQEADNILKHLKYNGASKIPVFNDPVTKYLMKTRWRWYQWASTVLDSELKWWHKEFVAAYNSYDATQIKQIGTPIKKVSKLIENIC